VEIYHNIEKVSRRKNTYLRGL